ncbi:tail fiber protein [Paenibacillus filicis]|uniref:Tail fiber protein n=1 Tax=Paenibacillus gyeongsangnamensis TaxID=3388067 RepID=A0ABT4Q8P1_9BACL|nr:tail fiber protein [Paenibacillus filicis]MCZ8513240.1 tail fiber protein [Paenibacillus filicis]
MSQPYVGEIRIFAGNFAPAGWMFCDGRSLAISEYGTLYNLIGTTYGGDGTSTFNLPDLRGRIPIHQGQNYTLVQQGGSETVTLTTSQIPAHNHAMSGQSKRGNTNNPQNAVWAKSTLKQFNSDAGSPNPMHPNIVSSIGGSQPHDNMMPYLTVNFIISLFGVFPSPN